MRSVAVKVIEKVRQTPTQCTLVLDWSPRVNPGQFVMVWIPGVDEVPMGFSRVEPNTSITVQRMGEATDALCDISPGDRVGVRGPLGRGFKLVRDERVLLVGGGNGVAPLVPLAQALVDGGCRVYTTVGARLAEELLFIEELATITGSSTHIATDDGSAGHHGFVTTLADRLMEELRPEMVFTCGPEIMMSKVAASCWDRSIPFQASLERYMKCGEGVCDACSVGSYLVCRDGPVFAGDTLRGIPDFGSFKRGPSGLKMPFGGPPADKGIGIRFIHED
jgi:dihydroorotate dehydrogenase electron transfer subunit